MYKQFNFLTLVLIGFGTTFFGCNKNNDPVPAFSNGTMQVTTTSSASNVTGATITEFRVNLEAVRFRTIANDPLLPDNTFQIAPLLGPFDLLLLGEGTGDNIPEAPLPDATYDRIKFDLVRGKAAPMDKITILIKGTIGTTPFEMWHDTEPGLQANLNDLVVNGNALSFGIDFVLDGLDLSAATDGDGNGIIEISPNDNDGNNNLADDVAIYIEKNFKVTY
ncbi:MAG: hypothetical protein OEX02_12155 [Cyclobacteriaceae bacterium]|nr:hypothetical protein [Cyclobacteriaceae bacterium]